MGEKRHNAYYGVASLIGIAGLTLAVPATERGWVHPGHVLGVGLLVVAALLFFLTATDRLPGLKDPKNESRKLSPPADILTTEGRYRLDKQIEDDKKRNREGPHGQS